jgi:hypothetical protein
MISDIYIYIYIYIYKTSIVLEFHFVLRSTCRYAMNMAEDKDLPCRGFCRWLTSADTSDPPLASGDILVCSHHSSPETTLLSSLPPRIARTT